MEEQKLEKSFSPSCHLRSRHMWFPTSVLHHFDDSTILCLFCSCSYLIIAFYSFSCVYFSVSAASQFLPYGLCLFSFFWVSFVFFLITQTVAFSACLIFKVPKKESLSKTCPVNQQPSIGWSFHARPVAKLWTDCALKSPSQSITCGHNSRIMRHRT